MKFKTVFRNELPETNSSSSHSVVINQLSNKGYTEIELDENGVFIIPDGTNYDFGRSSFIATNELKDKIAFVIALGLDIGKPMKKFLKLLKRTICLYTGAKDVVFDGIKSYNRMFKENLESGAFEDYYGSDIIWMMKDLQSSAFESVDHQSRDISTDIFENSDSLKDFLFNQDSWLFLRDDSVGDGEIVKFLDNKYKTEVSNDFSYASIDLGYNIGRIDFEIKNILNINFIKNEIIYGRDNLLDNLMFNKDLKKFEFNDFKSFISIDELNEKFLSFRRILYFNHYDIPGIVSHEDGIYIYFIDDKFRTVASQIAINVFNDKFIIDDECTITGAGRLCNHVIKDPSIVEGENYLKFKINFSINNSDLCIDI